MLVQVAASGRAETRPDEARFTAGVSTVAPGAAAASAANNAAIGRVVAALRGLGIAPDDVQTRSIALSRIDFGPNRGRFEANNMIISRSPPNQQGASVRRIGAPSRPTPVETRYQPTR